MISRKPISTAALPTLFFLASTAISLAQTPQPPLSPPNIIGSAIEQAAPPTREAQAKPPEDMIVVEAEPETLEIPDGETLLVKVFRIENSKEEDWYGLQEILAPMRFKDMTMADITEAANRVTSYHREKGYMTAKAYVPPQDASDGHIQPFIL